MIDHRSWGWCNMSHMHVATACALLVLIGCGDQQLPGNGIVAPVSPGRLATMLTGNARLTASGEIQVSGPILTSRPQIAASRADSLAQWWARTRAAMARPMLERQHGAALNIPALHVCGRTYFARSAFDPLPISLPDYAQRSFGPYWIVTICDDAEPAISLAVSAYATDLTLANGRVDFPKVSGEEFKWVGIPVGSSGLPLPPEEAVATMFAQTHRRVAADPELVILGHSIPQLARWHLHLDSVASLGTGHGIVHDQDVYVGRRRAGDTVLAHGAPSQPEGVAFHLLSPAPQHWSGPGAPPRTRYSAWATRTAGIPIVFEGAIGQSSVSTEP